MSYITVGIIDYGVGNHASVVHSLRDLGFRVRVSNKKNELDLVDVLLLPGVGAFPSAMASLHEKGLVQYLKERCQKGFPLIGICLGMQLLVSNSYEHTFTIGLDLIPGSIVPFSERKVHIGWNKIKLMQHEPLLSESDGEAFYFNHSFHYKGVVEFQAATTKHLSTFSSIIKNGNVVVLQFHPEKSQLAGKVLLKNLINRLVNA